MTSKTKSFVRKIQRDDTPEEWPHPFCPQVEHEPTFLFVFTPPNSGSTALAKILNSAHSSMTLKKNGEGQSLIPGLHKSGRWNPEMKIDWSSVKAVWMSKVRMVEELVGRIDFVIEKSPPNLVRSAQLLEQFPKHEIIVFNRNPYANCASLLYRHHQPDLKSEDERIATLKVLAKKWLIRAGYAKNIITHHSPVTFTYEELCGDVAATVAKIKEQIPLLEGISPELEIKVKDYPPQKISDQNKRQIANLSEREKEAIGESFKEHEELLNSFGYTSDYTEDVEQGGAGDVATRRV